jgi:hypothetical protein
MGFVLLSLVSTDFNDVDFWKEAVTPCRHGTTFQGDWPLKKNFGNLQAIRTMVLQNVVNASPYGLFVLAL